MYRRNGVDVFFISVPDAKLKPISFEFSVLLSVIAVGMEGGHNSAMAGSGDEQFTDFLEPKDGTLISYETTMRFPWAILVSGTFR